jgi:two-component system chemotaxis response regulator CheY
MKKILIIDDSPFITMEIKEIVTEAGYEVVAHSRNGEDGIKKFDEFRPDIVTLDIIMPGIDGIETAREIRRIEPNAKIIMLSSLCDDETKHELKEAGLDIIVEKPIEKKKLLSVLTSIAI